VFSEDPSVAGSTAAMLARPQGEVSKGHEKYDLLIKGGTVIDSSQDLQTPLDSAAVDVEISGMSLNMPEGRADVNFAPEVRLLPRGFIYRIETSKNDEYVAVSAFVPTELKLFKELIARIY
jgi:hypothetical protein